MRLPMHLAHTSVLQCVFIGLSTTHSQILHCRSCKEREEAGARKCDRERGFVACQLAEAVLRISLATALPLSSLGRPLFFVPFFGLPPSPYTPSTLLPVPPMTLPLEWDHGCLNKCLPPLLVVHPLAMVWHLWQYTLGECLVCLLLCQC